MSAITSVAELDALPVGATVITGSGYVYTRLATGHWTMPLAMSTPASWLLDPEHSRQPIRLFETTTTDAQKLADTFGHALAGLVIDAEMNKYESSGRPEKIGSPEFWADAVRRIDVMIASATSMTPVQP